MEENSILAGIFGDDFIEQKLIGQALGSPGTKSDLLFFNRLDPQSGHVFTAITPIDYPEKLKQFIQTLMLTNIHLLVINLDQGLTPAIGEILIGMDLASKLHPTRSIIIITKINQKNEWKLEDTKKKIKNVILNTSLRDSRILEITRKEDYDLIKSRVLKASDDLKNQIPINDNSHSKILIDHAFSVKGIGTVILGIVKNGQVHANQMLELVGNDNIPKKVIIRSIQKHDREFKTAKKWDRVGLALKGNVSPEKLNRDYMLVSPGTYKPIKRIKVKLAVNQYYKPKKGKIILGDSVQYYGFVDLKNSPIKIIEGDEILPGNTRVVDIEFEKFIFHDSIGLSGFVCELNRFENKSRIVGLFEQVFE
ncbi:MAG: hypothetical protein ACTSUX_14705 [Promethearchaeota archaeon]